MKRSTRVGILSGMLVFGVSLAGAAPIPATLAAASHHEPSAATKKIQAKESHDKYLFAPQHITVKKGTEVIWTLSTAPSR
jgi:plastocyanin